METLNYQKTKNFKLISYLIYSKVLILNLMLIFITKH